MKQVHVEPRQIRLYVSFVFFFLLLHQNSLLYFLFWCVLNLIYTPIKWSSPCNDRLLYTAVCNTERCDGSQFCKKKVALMQGTTQSVLGTTFSFNPITFNKFEKFSNRLLSKLRTLRVKNNYFFRQLVCVIIDWHPGLLVGTPSSRTGCSRITRWDVATGCRVPVWNVFNSDTTRGGRNHSSSPLVKLLLFCHGSSNTRNGALPPPCACRIQCEWALRWAHDFDILLLWTDRILY